MTLDNKQLQRKFIYFPSFDAGPAGNSYKKDLRFKDGTPYRFYQEGFPKNYLHKRFLFPAGHNYKNMNLRKQFQFPPGTIVFGDSGGYQIATGILKWDSTIQQKIFEWLEENSDIAMNIDIPTRGMYEGKFEECLKISSENFKYFHDNQTGKTRFLNVLQGTNQGEYKRWYDEVKQYDFQGWAIGGGRNIYNLMSALAILLEGKEHLNKNNKVLHILGVSKIADFLLLGQLQRSLNEIGSNMQVTTDSSSPSRSTVYGFWYTGFDIKEEVFRCVHIPRKDKANILDTCTFGRLPAMCPEIDKVIFDNFTLNEFMEMKTEHYAAMVLHNFGIFIDAINQCNELVYSDRYILDQLLCHDSALILKSIDEMIKTGKPMEVFNKYLPIYKKVAAKQDAAAGQETVNEFFQL